MTIACQLALPSCTTEALQQPAANLSLYSSVQQHVAFEGECTAAKMCQSKLLQGMRFELHISTHYFIYYLCLFRLSLGVFGRTGGIVFLGGRTT